MARYWKAVDHNDNYVGTVATDTAQSAFDMALDAWGSDVEYVEFWKEV